MIKYFSSGRHATTILIGSVFLFLSACAAIQPPEQNVGKRAMERWDALLSGDQAGAYLYLSPGFRSSVSVEQYQKSLSLMRVRWTSAEYIESNCAETICKVRISLGYSVAGAVPGIKTFKGVQDIEESWVLSGGSWYLVPKQ